MVDPDPRVSGTGLAHLRDHGVDVKVLMGSEGEACKRLNFPFIHRLLYKRPLSVVWASIMDKKVTQSGDEYQTFLTDKCRDITNAFISVNNGQEPNLSLVALMLPSVAPEVDTVVLTADYFLRQLPEDLSKFPSHITIAIANDESKNYEAKKFNYSCIKEHIQSCAVFRHWIVVQSTNTNAIAATASNVYELKGVAIREM